MKHTAAHTTWDQGGFCNALVIDEFGDGDVCGVRTHKSGKRVDSGKGAALATLREKLTATRVGAPTVRGRHFHAESLAWVASKTRSGVVE